MSGQADRGRKRPMQRSRSATRRVTRGGIFHNKKVDYSLETQNLLKELLRESQLTMIERTRLTNIVDRGESLPSSSGRIRSSSADRPERHAPSSSKPQSRGLRRSHATILNSGDLQAIHDPPTLPHPVDRAKEKARLQRLMTYGKSTLEIPIKTTGKKKPLKLNKVEIFQHIAEEMRDRQQFLREMDDLGQGKQYKGVIIQELQEKFQQMVLWDRELPLEDGPASSLDLTAKSRPSSAESGNSLHSADSASMSISKTSTHSYPLPSIVVHPPDTNLSKQDGPSNNS